MTNIYIYIYIHIYISIPFPPSASRDLLLYHREHCRERQDVRTLYMHHSFISKLIPNLGEVVNSLPAGLALAKIEGE